MILRKKDTERVEIQYCLEFNVIERLSNEETLLRYMCNDDGSASIAAQQAGEREIRTIRIHASHSLMRQLCERPSDTLMGASAVDGNDRSVPG
jgi:hypothetical protein